jgi:PhoH-like ATPase
MTKIFLLDTSVVLYDASAISRFQEHDVAVPITVIEELDDFKKGHGVINLQARRFLRELDRLSASTDVREWTPLDGPGRGRVRVVSPNGASGTLPAGLGSQKNDHRILEAAIDLAREEPQRPVILVSKDINLRIKARGLGLQAEDYESVWIDDIERLYRGTGEAAAADEAIGRLHDGGELPRAEALAEPPPANQFFILRGSGSSALASYDADGDLLRKLDKATAYGVQPRNAEQTFALSAVMNPRLSLVSLTGPAGTGKTLLALAGALARRRDYRQILLSRPIIPLGNRDIGYLPGDVEAKISPYMQPLWDNLGVIRNQFKPGQREYRRIEEMLRLDKLHILPLAYIRGRSLNRILFIVDEAQNLTPHEVKTVITRAGEGTKVVFTGDVHQIDTPYLDEHSNGLSYLIDRMKGHPLYAHVHLHRGERSALANVAAQRL